MTKREVDSADEATLTESVARQFMLDAPRIDFAGEHMTNKEREVDDTSPLGNIAAQARGGPRRVRRLVITYHWPVKGQTALLRLQPSNFTTWAPLVYLAGSPDNEEVCIDVIRQSDDPEPVKREAERVKGYLQTYGGNLVQDIERHNNDVRSRVPSLLAARKKHIEDDEDFMRRLKP
jgi:hypothetical protein